MEGLSQKCGEEVQEGKSPSLDFSTPWRLCLLIMTWDEQLVS